MDSVSRSEVQRVEDKIDDLSGVVTTNHLEILRSIESLKENHVIFQISQIDKLHELTKKVERHDGHFDSIGKFMLGGGLASLVGAFVYLKDNFFKH